MIGMLYYECKVEEGAKEGVRQVPGLREHRLKHLNIGGHAGERPNECARTSVRVKELQRESSGRQIKNMTANLF